MARADQGPIETFMSITGASQAVAVQKLQDCGGDLNEAVNSYFTEGDRNITRQAPVPASENDFMAIDDDPIQVESQGPSLPLLSAAANLNPFSLLDPRFRRSFFEGRGPPEFASETPYVTHPREVREIPIEVKDENGQSSRSGSGPTVEDVTGTACAGPEIRGAVIIDDDEEDEIMPTVTTRSRSFGQNERGVFSGHSLRERNLVPSAPGIDNVNDYGNDIEEEMIRAAIEASKREVSDDMLNQQIEATTNDPSGPALPQRQSHGEDAELARAVSLSIQTAEREKALREQGGLLENAEKGALNSSDVEEVGKITVTSGRQGIGSFGLRTSGQPYMEAGGSSFQDEAEDAEEQPLVRQRSRRVSFGSDSGKEGSEMEDSPPSSPAPRDNNRPQLNGNVLPTDEWGGISSEEHDEAVMLEAALFGGIPEGTPYRFGYPPQQPMPMGPDRDFYPHVPRPPSPNLTAQRLLREQQDDEYLASLQADREKELKAMEEAEARRLTEQAAKDAALEEERKREEETRQKLLEEEELERQLAAKEASLPQEPTSDDESSVTLLVRMPDGSRRGRRFLKSDNLQSLFDFIDVGRAVKPGTYRLVRPYPRRTFSDGDSKLSLSDLGLTSKQEALFLELI